MIGDVTDPCETLNCALSTFKTLSSHNSKMIHFLDCQLGRAKRLGSIHNALYSGLTP